MFAGGQGYDAIAGAFLKTIHVDGLLGHPRDNLGPGEAVYATDLYPDLQYKSVRDYLQMFV